MLTLQRTKHSDFLMDVFNEKNRGIDISVNNWFFANELIEQGYDEKSNKKAHLLLKEFISFLKQNHLKLVTFGVGFNHDLSKYSYKYVVRSKVHSNQDFRVEGYAERYLEVPFSFFPQVFSTWICQILENIPFDQLTDVAQGN